MSRSESFSFLRSPVKESGNACNEDEETDQRLFRLRPYRIEKNSEVDQNKKDRQDWISPCLIGAGDLGLFGPQDYDCQSGCGPEYDKSEDNELKEVLIGSG